MTMALGTLDTCQLTTGLNVAGSITPAGALNPTSGVATIQRQDKWTIGTAAKQATEVAQCLRTLAASATDNIDLSGALTDICNQLGLTLTSICGIVIELLSPVDDTTNGTLCSSIEVGNGSNPWLAPFAQGAPTWAAGTYAQGRLVYHSGVLYFQTNAVATTDTPGTGSDWVAVSPNQTGIYTIKNGGMWSHVDKSAAGLVVTAATGDILKILNKDSVVAAAYRLTIIGRG